MPAATATPTCIPQQQVAMMAQPGQQQQQHQASSAHMQQPPPPAQQQQQPRSQQHQMSALEHQHQGQPQQPHREQEAEEQLKRAAEEAIDDLSKLSIDEQVAAIEGAARVREPAEGTRRRTDKNRKKKERRRQQKQKSQDDRADDGKGEQVEQQSCEAQVDTASETTIATSAQERLNVVHSSVGGAGSGVAISAEPVAAMADADVVTPGEECDGDDDGKEVVEERAEESEDAWLCEGAPDDLLCPVSLVLLTDPVVAPDGRTYQREELQRCINYAADRGEEFRSPVTNLPMAPVYFPNVLIRSQVLEHIERKRAQRAN